MKTKSNLLNFISHLMHDDDALHRFSVDPITISEQDYGLTKAERAVLRRTVHGLSNNSLNGYSMQRDYHSYRKSLRLLQNVLCNVGSKIAMDTVDTPDNHYNYCIQTFIPYVSSGVNDFTGKNNTFVDNNFRGPYFYSFFNHVTLENPNPTIKEVMDASGIQYDVVYNAKNEEFVSSFNFRGIEIKADLSDPRYKEQGADFVFWFYSMDGRANPRNSGHFGTSFAEQKLNPGETVVWQLIAPDCEYGFKPCIPHEHNVYAKTVKRGISQ